jgi:NADH dehydrogenase
MSTNKAPHIVIIGAGFGGMETAKRLAKAPVRITLVDRKNYHLFQPLLYQVAIAGLVPSQIAYPVRTIFRKQANFTFEMGEVSTVDLQAGFIKMNGSVIAYDYLVIATGGQTNFFKIESVANNAFHLKGINKAINTRNHLLSVMERASHEADAERRRAMLTFVVVGGGPTGVETAGALSELIRHVLTKDYPGLDVNDVRVLLLEAGSTVMPAYPPELRRATQHLLEKKGVVVMLDTRVLGYDGEQVTLGDGTCIKTPTLIWTAGVRASDLASRLGVEQAGAGQVVVEKTLQLPGHPNVFVIGDSAYVLDEGGRPLPMLATVAQQEAGSVAQNIRRMLKGQPSQPFKYRDPGLLATIGRNAAVARIWGLSFSGFIAWVIWVGLHIYRLIGFRSRLAVLLNWAWDYIFYETQVRLITKD